jgi:hypothetical protein
MRSIVDTAALEKGKSYSFQYEVNFGDAGTSGVEQIIPLFTLPKGGVIRKVWTRVVQVFNSGSSDLLTVGRTGDTDHFQDAGDITEGTTGKYEDTVSGILPYIAEADMGIVAGYTSTGTVPTTGRAHIYVHWDYLGL